MDQKTWTNTTGYISGKNINVSYQTQMELPSLMSFKAEYNGIKTILRIKDEESQLKVLELFSHLFSEHGIDHVVEYYEGNELVNRVER